MQQCNSLAKIRKGSLKLYSFNKITNNLKINNQSQPGKIDKNITYNLRGNIEYTYDARNVMHLQSDWIVHLEMLGKK